jgi:hypothetical protein
MTPIRKGGGMRRSYVQRVGDRPVDRDVTRPHQPVEIVEDAGVMLP